MNRLFLILAVIFFLIGSYTILSVYSKIFGTFQFSVFECAKNSLENRCIVQNSVNNFLEKILPDKNSNLIKKFSPSLTQEEE